MDIVDGVIQFSANDLVNHLACRRLTELNHEVAGGRRSAPAGWDPTLDLLRARGLAHERAFIEHLKDRGEPVTVIAGVGVDDVSVADTKAAMRAGDQVIYQAALRHGHFAGRADILRRVDVPSALGGWSYEVTDAKLARETRSGAILQISLYSDLVGAIQDRLPEFMHVIVPGTEFEPEQYRTGDYAAYYRFVRRWLEDSVNETGMSGVYPDPKEHCSVCRWSGRCSARRRDDDHLCLGRTDIGGAGLGLARSHRICPPRALMTKPLGRCRGNATSDDTVSDDGTSWNGPGPSLTPAAMTRIQADRDRLCGTDEWIHITQQRQWWLKMFR